MYGASWLLLLRVINTCKTQQINVIKPHISRLSTGINMIYGMTMIQFRNDFIIMHPIILSWLKYNIVFFTEYKGNCYQSVSNILILQEWTIFRTTQVQSIVCTSAMLKLVTYRFFCTQHQSEASKKVPRCFCQNPKRRWIWQFCTNHFIVRVGSNTNQRTSPSLPSSRPKSFKFWYLLWWSGGVGWFLLTNTTKQRFCVPKKERKHATT